MCLHTNISLVFTVNLFIRVSYKPCTASTMAWLVERPGPSTISRRLMLSTIFITAVIRQKRSRAEGARKVECQKMMLEYKSQSICSCGFKDLLPCCFCQTEIAIFLCFSYFIQLSQGISISSTLGQIHCCSILLL